MAGQALQRLLNQRIVMASGCLDGEAATRLCAQLLTLDAEGGRSGLSCTTSMPTCPR